MPVSLCDDMIRICFDNAFSGDFSFINIQFPKGIILPMKEDRTTEVKICGKRSREDCEEENASNKKTRLDFDFWDHLKNLESYKTQYYECKEEDSVLVINHVNVMSPIVSESIRTNADMNLVRDTIKEIMDITCKTNIHPKFVVTNEFVLETSIGDIKLSFSL
jgi:hypothetical protein